MEHLIVSEEIIHRVTETLSIVLVSLLVSVHETVVLMSLYMYETLQDVDKEVVPFPNVFHHFRTVSSSRWCYSLCGLPNG